MVMETVMNGIEKFADYYRAYLPHERSSIPLTIALATTVVVWLLLYLAPMPEPSLPNVRPTTIVSGQLSR